MNFRCGFPGGSRMAILSLLITVVGLLAFAYIRTTMSWGSSDYRLYTLSCWIMIFGGMVGFHYYRRRS